MIPRIEGVIRNDKSDVSFDRYCLLLGPIDPVSMCAVSVESDPTCFEAASVEFGAGR